MKMRWSAVAMLVGLSLGFARASAEDAAAPAPLSFRVAGDVGSPRTWTVAELTKELAAEVKDVDWTLKDVPHKSKAIPLAALVRAAKPVVSEQVKHHDLSFVVVVRSRDGYTAAFSLAELDPALRGTQAWVSLDDDAKGLSEKDMPAGLLVTNDGKKSRWVRGLDAIFVLDARKVLPK